MLEGLKQLEDWEYYSEISRTWGIEEQSIEMNLRWA